MAETPRLRMFAGPNGSGKSTIKDVIPTHQKGVYINPDDIESNAKESGTLYFEDYSVYLSSTAIKHYFYQSSEPPRLFRRPVCLSQAASPDSSK